MANAFLPEEKTWVIDTGANSPVDTNDLRVAGIRWVAAGASAGNTAVIQNNEATPKTMWEAVASAANFIDTDNAKRRWPGGFRVLTLAAGKLYILLE